MRALVLVVVACIATGCGHHDASGGARAGSDDSEREQARFDAERRPEHVIEAMAIGPGARVADIGAGSGLLTVHLARAVAPGGKVVATDIDGAILELLGQRLDRLGLGALVERRVVSAEHAGLEPGAYDAILLAEVDHLLPDPAAWLAEARTALKPRGRIVISNRIYHRAQSMAAAKKAGLGLVAESTPVPTHFIAVFVAGPGEGK